MLKLGVILALLVDSLVGQPTLRGNELGGRIVNGTEADIRTIPYVVSLHFKWPAKALLCGGSIIAESWVLSAAHCTRGVNAQSLFVRAGTAKEVIGGRIHYVSKIVNHPDFDESVNPSNDISLLKVAKPFQYTPKIQPVSLAPAGSMLAEGTMLTVAGWGATAEGGDISPTLLEASVPAVSNRVCARAYAQLPISDSMLCAGYRSGGMDACQGDSGGPLVHGNVQVGVVSWGAGCARPGLPGVYTRISAFRAWVRETAGV
ncbi:trypsin-1-like [Bacillus rossius redtenbacheri]|uniref:trypsin-1-like n=1 Tax=Bacillus rossius redtenbacheri TaxID=93214 RepID=UPI002FDD1C7A